jgi:hypothetical protein
VADTIHVLGEGGVVFEMTLPLHEAIQDRLTQGFLKRANPDGSLYVEGDEPPVEAGCERAEVGMGRVGRPAGRRPGRRSGVDEI